MRLAGETHASLITCTFLENAKHDMSVFFIEIRRAASAKTRRGAADRM